MKYLLVENTPAIAKDKKPKPVQTNSLAKTIGGFTGGMMAQTERFGVGKPLQRLDKAVSSRVTPKLASKMGKFGTSRIGAGLARAGGWTAGAGLGSWGLGATLAGGAGALLGSGLVGAAEKIYKKYKSSKMNRMQQ